MKSANALLMLQVATGTIPAGTSVPALVISDLHNYGTDGCLFPTNLSSCVEGSKNSTTSASHETETRVAILTVSDTVASGSAPDRRFTLYWFHYSFSLCIFKYLIQFTTLCHVKWHLDTSF